MSAYAHVRSLKCKNKVEFFPFINHIGWLIDWFWGNRLRKGIRCRLNNTAFHMKSKKCFESNPMNYHCLYHVAIHNHERVFHNFHSEKYVFFNSNDLIYTQFKINTTEINYISFTKYKAHIKSDPFWSLEQKMFNFSLAFIIIYENMQKPHNLMSLRW